MAVFRSLEIPWRAKVFALCWLLCCTTYRLRPLEPVSPGTGEIRQEHIRLVAKSHPSAPGRPPAVPQSLTAVWLEVTNEGATRVQLLISQLKLRVAGHALAPISPQAIPLVVRERAPAAIPYSWDTSTRGASQGVATPNNRFTNPELHASSREYVLRTAFEGGLLEPGGQREGFVYFALPEERFARLGLVLPVQSAETDEPIELTVLFRQDES